MVIFIDASVFCAYANKDDTHHKKSVSIMNSISKNDEPVTTDYIFDETVTVALRKASKREAVNVGHLILNSETLLIQVGKYVFDRAWEIFKESESLSFTDCTNIAFMKIFGIKKIASFDKKFKDIKGIEVVDS